MNNDYELKMISEFLEKNIDILNKADQAENIEEGSKDAQTKGEIDLIHFLVMLESIAERGDQLSARRALKLLAYLLGFYAHKSEMEGETDE